VCYLRPSTAVTHTDVTRDDRKARITTITTCALRPQWQCYLTKQTRWIGQKWPANCWNGESREVQACTRRCPLLISYADHPCYWLTRRVLSNSHLAAVYLCRLLFQTTEAVWGSQDVCWQHQAASVVWASPGVERRDTWQINCWYWISHGTLPAPPPLVFVYRFTSVSHDLQWGSLHDRRCFVILH